MLPQSAAKIQARSTRRRRRLQLVAAARQARHRRAVPARPARAQAVRVHAPQVRAAQARALPVRAAQPVNRRPEQAVSPRRAQVANLQLVAAVEVQQVEVLLLVEVAPQPAAVVRRAQVAVAVRPVLVVLPAAARMLIVQRRNPQRALRATAFKARCARSPASTAGAVTRSRSGRAPIRQLQAVAVVLLVRVVAVASPAVVGRLVAA
jgi:hypothetical protein